MDASPKAARMQLKDEPVDTVECGTAFAQFMDRAHAKAMRIAKSRDERDRLRLLMVASKVAQMHPAFARDLLTIVEGAIREHTNPGLSMNGVRKEIAP